MHRRTDAFSLIEMLVVLILSSIIVSIIYFTYYTVSTYQLTLSRKQQSSSDLALLYFLLRKDVDQAERVVALSPEKVQTIGNDALSVYYAFDSMYVLRTQLERVDTLHGKFGAPSFRWHARSADHYPIIIDQVDVAIIGLAEEAQIHILKQYDAASLVNFNNQDSLP